MTTTIPTSKSACSVTTRPGNAAVDYGGAQIRAYLHHLATVVTIRGEIDAANVEQISEHVRRFSLGTNPMVLDLSELSHFSGPASRSCASSMRTAEPPASSGH